MSVLGSFLAVLAWLAEAIEAQVAVVKVQAQAMAHPLNHQGCNLLAFVTVELGSVLRVDVVRFQQMRPLGLSEAALLEREEVAWSSRRVCFLKAVVHAPSTVSTLVSQMLWDFAGTRVALQ